MIASYPHIVSLGHASLGRELFAGSTIVEEKIVGEIIHEVMNDIVREEQENIKETLWKWGMGNITRKAVKGCAEWYKQRLAQEMIDDTRETTNAGDEVSHAV